MYCMLDKHGHCFIYSYKSTIAYQPRDTSYSMQVAACAGNVALSSRCFGGQFSGSVLVLSDLEFG